MSSEHLQAAKTEPMPVADNQVGRAFFHMTAVTAAMLYFYFTDTTGAMVLFVVGVVVTFLDLGRSRFSRVRALIPGFLLRMVREREQNRLSAITHFIIAATLIDGIYLTLGLDKDAVLIALMFVAFGDPLARLVGRSVSSPVLLKTGRTLAGSTAFFVAGALAATAVAAIVGASISPLQVLVGGLIMTLIELISRDWDNFHLPFFGSLVMLTLGWGI